VGEEEQMKRWQKNVGRKMQRRTTTVGLLNFSAPYFSASLCLGYPNVNRKRYETA
jgi:hypothetical protein